MINFRVYLGTSLLLIVIVNSYAQVSTQSRDSLFGVPLTPEAKIILERVEKIYGKEVKEEWINDKGPMAQAGSSNVGEDGTPTISINPIIGRTVGTIVHELYHFIQRSQGYPVIWWLIPTYMDTEITQNAFRQLNEQIHDPILHYIFFDTLRSLGIHPDEDIEVRTRQFLNDGTLESVLTSMDTKAVALYYFKVRLELDDSALLDRIVHLLIFKNKQEGLGLGRRISQIVLDANPKSPMEDINALVNCLNVLYQGQFYFKQREWTSRALGNHLQKIAQIELQVL